MHIGDFFSGVCYQVRFFSSSVPICGMLFWPSCTNSPKTRVQVDFCRLEPRKELLPNISLIRPQYPAAHMALLLFLRCWDPQKFDSLRIATQLYEPCVNSEVTRSRARLQNWYFPEVRSPPTLTKPRPLILVPLSSLRRCHQQHPGSQKSSQLAQTAERGLSAWQTHQDRPWYTYRGPNPGLGFSSGSKYGPAERGRLLSHDKIKIVPTEKYSFRETKRNKYRESNICLKGEPSPTCLSCLNKLKH